MDEVVKVVGLDLSLTATGMASDQAVVVLKTPVSKYSGMKRLSYIRDQVLDFIWNATIETPGSVLVAAEGYSFQSKDSHAHALGELGGVVRMSMWEHGIEYVDVAPKVLKKYATGKGNASKDEVLAAAVRRFPDLDITNNNQADAQWLYAMGRDGLDDPIVKMPELNRSVLTSVLWRPVVTVGA